jgi:GTP-binding protein EngB required for normal cell division
VAPDSESLNEDQVRRLRITCEHIDRLLSEIEGILHESTSLAAFPSYTSDLTPAQRKTIEDYIARVRARLIQVLDGQEIQRRQPWVPVSRAIKGRLYSIDIAAEELKPKYMRGFGGVSDTTAKELNGIAGELQALVARLERYLAGGTGKDFRKRLQRLEGAGNDLDLLSRIERVVAGRGLVEFRGTIASILDRAEDRSFEIAVFGRVSSGKSSLLNTVLDTDILPVGVTPVTAVPTRIIHGETRSLTVSFANAPAKTVEILRLGEFATEQQNPGNTKHVSRITVTLPAPRLSRGVTFVDTPGLGSLATSGAAETLAYLPRCDLGVVLIDAGSTLTSGDLQTILTLQEAAVPAHVLLSKADLLNQQDCEKTLAYVRKHIVSETGLDIPVHPVSVRPSHRTLLDRWFEEEILPLFSRSQELRAASLQRKIGSLRESVVFVLSNKIQRDSLRGENVDIRAIESQLRLATGLIDETRTACEREIKKMADNIPEIFSAAAASVRKASSRTDPGMGPDDIIRTAVLQAVHGWARNVQRPVETLALQLQDELVKSAGDLGIADMPGGDEFLSLVRNMPVFDPGPIHLTAPKSAISALLGRSCTDNYTADYIRRQLGEPFTKALASYLRLLQEWSKGVTNQLGQRFEIYAERYRAQADQSSGRQDVSMDEIRAIEEDLRILGGSGTDKVFGETGRKEV